MCIRSTHAERIGLFELDVIAGHAVWVDDREIALLAERGVTVAHNPVANAILGSGVAPVRAAIAAGIPVGIGTDGAASNDSQNMLEAIKWAALLQKVHHLDPAVIDARAVLRLATIGGAHGRSVSPTRSASLEPGMRADVVLFQDAVEVGVLHDPAGQLVYGASPRAVADVLVDGRRVVRDHRLRDGRRGGADRALPPPRRRASHGMPGSRRAGCRARAAPLH